MKQFKYIAQFYYTRFPLRVLILFSPLVYFLHWKIVASERKKFKRKLEEREENARMKFQEFTDSFSINDAFFLKDFVTNEKIDISNFKENYMIFFFGDIEYFAKIFKEYEENTLKVFDNVKILYILESETTKKILEKIPTLKKEAMNISYIPEEVDKSELNLNINTVYLMSPSKKLLYTKKIEQKKEEDNNFHQIIKDINLKIRREAESEFINTFKF